MSASSTRLSLGVAGVDVELPANGEDRVVTFTWADAVTEDWLVVVDGDAVATLSSGGTTVDVTFAQADVEKAWHVGPADGPEVARGRLVRSATASPTLAADVSELTIDVGASTLTIDVVARGATGIVAVDGTAADADLAAYDAETRTLTVDVPDASDIDGDWSGVGLTATDTEAAITETMTTLGTAIASATGTATTGRRIAIEAAEQAAASRPRLTRWAQSAASVAVTEAARSAVDLDMWPDGSIGFASIGGTIYGFAANGENSARWTATAGTLLGTVQATDATITTTIPSDYAAGGSIVAQGSGKIVKLYHAEKHATVSGEASSFLSWLGLAVADESDPDDWTDLGAIITPSVGVDAAMWCDIGGGAACVVDGYLYVYFSDTLNTAYDRNLFAVARCPVADILTWANGGAAATFSKWHLGAWDEPGIDGDSSPVLVGAPTPNWCDAITLTSHDDRVLLVWSGKLAPESNDTHWGVWCAVSDADDPLSFGRVETIVEPTRRFIAYPTLVAPDLSGLGNTVSGDDVRLYLTESDVGAFENGGTRWQDAWVSLRTLSWQDGRMTLLGGQASFYDGTNPYPRLTAGYSDAFGVPFIGFSDGAAAPATGFASTVNGSIAVTGDTTITGDDHTITGDTTVNGDLDVVGHDITAVLDDGAGGTVKGSKFWPITDPNPPPGPNVGGQIAVIDGDVCVCTVPGSPGTWVAVEKDDIGTWANVSLINSWALTPAVGAAKYRVDGRRKVELFLAVRSGTSGTVIGNIPAPYRPAEQVLRLTFAFNVASVPGSLGTASVVIGTNGDITVSGNTGPLPDVYLHTHYVRALA